MAETGRANVSLRYFAGQKWPGWLWMLIGFVISIAGAVVSMAPFVLLPPGQYPAKAAGFAWGGGIIIGFWMVRIGWREIFGAIVRMKRREEGLENKTSRR